MSEMFFWLCACVGMTNIIVESEISKKVKDFMESFTHPFIIKMLNCYQCAGFWAGIVVTTGCLLTHNCLFENWFYVFMGGCESSFVSTFFAIFQTYLEANSMVKE